MQGRFPDCPPGERRHRLRSLSVGNDGSWYSPPGVGNGQTASGCKLDVLVSVARLRAASQPDYETNPCAIDAAMRRPSTFPSTCTAGLRPRAVGNHVATVAAENCPAVLRLIAARTAQRQAQMREMRSSHSNSNLASVEFGILASRGSGLQWVSTEFAGRASWGSTPEGAQPQACQCEVGTPAACSAAWVSASLSLHCVALASALG